MEEKWLQICQLNYSSIGSLFQSIKFHSQENPDKFKIIIPNKAQSLQVLAIVNYQISIPFSYKHQILSWITTNKNSKLTEV